MHDLEMKLPHRALMYKAFCDDLGDINQVLSKLNQSQLKIIMFWEKANEAS